MSAMSNKIKKSSRKQKSLIEIESKLLTGVVTIGSPAFYLTIFGFVYRIKERKYLATRNNFRIILYYFMLAIRFARVGKKNKAQFQIVAQEHTVAPGGRHIEVLGSWDPHQKVAVLKEERIKYWLSQGAQDSDSVYNLFVSKGVISGEKRKVKMPKKVEKVKAEEPKKEVPH